MNYLIPIAYASAQGQAQCFVDKINQVLLFPLITLLMALAFLIFIYGAFEYVKNANNDAARETGRQHLFYGVIGMLVMLSAMAILNIAAGTFGLSVGEYQCDTGASATETLSTTAGFNPGATTGGATLPDIAPTVGSESPRGLGNPSPIAGAESGAFGTGVALGTASDSYVFRSAPAQPLTPTQEQNYKRYVGQYVVQAPTNETAVLTKYAGYGVTQVVFMVPVPTMYTQTGGTGAQEVGSYDQQVAACDLKGGSMTTESGSSKVTDVSMYICLR